MDAPVSNNACVCRLYTCMLYSAWKPSMNTSLITDVLGVASHAEESSESSNIIFSNSAKKLLNSSLLSLAGVHISFICLLSLNFLWKVFIKLHCLSFIDLYFVGEFCLGGCWTVHFVVFSLAMPTFGFFLACWWLVCAFCSLPGGSVRRTRICGWNILNFECWEWIHMWPFEVNGHICYILQNLGHGSPFFALDLANLFLNLLSLRSFKNFAWLVPMVEIEVILLVW